MNEDVFGSMLASADQATHMTKDSFLRSTMPTGSFLEAKQSNRIDELMMQNQFTERINRNNTVQARSIADSRAFPCPLLKFMSATRDLEQIKFQLEVNHYDNDSREDHHEEVKKSLG